MKLVVLVALLAMAAFPASLTEQSALENTLAKRLTGIASAGEVSTVKDDPPKKKFQLVLSKDLGRFIEELNKLGKLKYRVAKAINYGGDSSLSQTYVAVMALDAEETFEYDWLTSPNKGFLESRLNNRASQGFNAVQILPHTSCSDKEAESDTQPFPVGDLLLRLTKGDVFLLERRNGNAQKSKEFKVFTGKIGLGKSPTADLQAALDTSPAGFQPFGILFSKSGTFDFAVSVLIERDLKNTDTEKVGYRFFKDVNGFEKEINSSTKEGFQLLAGRRIGLMKFALMAKLKDDSVSYILLDADKYQKEFSKKISTANKYKGLFLGDTSCGEPETKGAKLVFAATSNADQKYEYKFLKLSDAEAFPTEGSVIAELDKLLEQNFRIRDVFFSDGPTIIMERN